MQPAMNNNFTGVLQRHKVPLSLLFLVCLLYLYLRQKETYTDEPAGGDSQGLRAFMCKKEGWDENTKNLATHACCNLLDLDCRTKIHVEEAEAHNMCLHLDQTAGYAQKHREYADKMKSCCYNQDKGKLENVKVLRSKLELHCHETRSWGA